MAFVAGCALRICLIAQKNKKTNPRANACAENKLTARASFLSVSEESCAENKQKNFFETKGDFGPMKTKGFTLVELLVVIAILAILATVSVVGYTSFIDRAEQSNADTEAHQIKASITTALIGADVVVVDDAIWALDADNDGTPEFVTTAPATTGKVVMDLSGDLAAAGTLAYDATSKTLTYTNTSTSKTATVLVGE